MSHKRSTPEFKGAGFTQRYAKKLQSQFRLTWSAALAKAQLELEPAPFSTAPDDLEDMTVSELKVLASQAGLIGYSNMTKAELIELINHPPPLTDS